MSDTPQKPIAPAITNTTRRDALLAVVSGLLVLGFVIYAIIYLSSRMTSHSLLTGVVTARHFTPEPQTQITIGKQGFSKKKVAGEYTFEVYVDSNGKTYIVSVDPKVFDAKKVGDTFQFPRPGSSSNK